LEPANARPLGEICSRPEFKAQLVYASATLGERAHAFADKYMRPDRVSTHVAGGALPEDAAITHYGLHVRGAADKEDALVDVLRSGHVPRALVFVNKLFSVSQLYNLLQDCGIPCAGLSSERNKQTREQALQGFRRGDLQVLIATDAAAR